MDKPISKYKLKVSSFVTELDKPLDSSLRSVVATEVEIKSEEMIDNGDGEYDLIYKAGVVGQTDITQSNQKVAKGKSKRKQSQKIRQCCWVDNPSEEYYEWFTNGIINHYDEIKSLLNQLK